MIIVHNTQISNTISHGEYLAVNNVWKGMGLIWSSFSIYRDIFYKARYFRYIAIFYARNLYFYYCIGQNNDNKRRKRRTNRSKQTKAW